MPVSPIFSRCSTHEIAGLLPFLREQRLEPGETLRWTALVIALLLIIAIIGYSVHKISPDWITSGVFCAFLVLVILHDKHIRHDFRRGVLLLVGIFIGLEDTLDYRGFTAILFALGLSLPFYRYIGLL